LIYVTIVNYFRKNVSYKIFLKYKVKRLQHQLLLPVLF